jgi:hypothetical protein
MAAAIPADRAVGWPAKSGRTTAALRARPTSVCPVDGRSASSRLATTRRSGAGSGAEGPRESGRRVGWQRSRHPTRTRTSVRRPSSIATKSRPGKRCPIRPRPRPERRPARPSIGASFACPIPAFWRSEVDSNAHRVAGVRGAAEAGRGSARCTGLRMPTQGRSSRTATVCRLAIGSILRPRAIGDHDRSGLRQRRPRSVMTLFLPTTAPV